MIGGLFKPAGFASIAAAGLLMGGVSAAHAADLGGNCCADLEERVAELEATTARKGNRKVSLEVSGHVHEAIVFFDAPGEQNSYIGTHNSSRSRFRFKGSAKINADWSAGFLMEFGVRANNLAANDQDSPYNISGLDIRHEALYVKSRTLGTLWLGWTSSATDGITEICLGCGLGNGPDYSDDMGDMFDAFGNRFDVLGGGGAAFTGEGDRREVIRWISPTLAGFVLSAAYGQDDFYDVALRYAGEFGPIRIAAGVGYQYDSTGNSGPGFISSAECNDGPGLSTYECESIGASASIQHTPSGLYLAGAYGYTWDDTNNVTGSEDNNEAWHVTGGINQKFFAMGKTNIWGMYTQADRGIEPTGVDSQLVVYGAGIEQSIDAAAMEMYFWWKRFEGEVDGADSGEMDQFVAGARIRF